MKIQLIPLWTLFILMTGCTSFPRIYSGESIHGWVIDSKTKEPIKDVVAVEIWELEGGFHSDHTANIHIAETVTDEEGYYTFPEWGPKFTVDGVMGGSSPHLVFYKFGYDDARRFNRVSGNLNPDNSVSEYSGKKIELVKFEGEAKIYESKVRLIDSLLQLSNYRDEFDCMWVKIPKFTAEMIKLDAYFKEHQVSNSIPSLRQIPSDKCGNRDIILKDYL